MLRATVSSGVPQDEPVFGEEGPSVPSWLLKPLRIRRRGLRTAKQEAASASRPGVFKNDMGPRLRGWDGGSTVGGVIVGGRSSFPRRQ